MANRHLILSIHLLQKSFSSSEGTGKMPIPQELFFLVGWASCPSYLFLQEVYCMLRQELTIAYQHRQQGNSGHRTVPFSYPNIIDRAIGCHDRTAIEDTAPCGFPTPKLSSPSEDVIITRFFGKRHCGVLISGNGYSSARTGAQKP